MKLKLKRSQIVTLAVGGSITVFLIGFYFVKDRTSLLVKEPLVCRDFKTSDPRFKGSVKMCVNGVLVPYSNETGEVEIDLDYKTASGELVEADVIAGIADKIIQHPVHSEGDIVFKRVRIFDKGFLAEDDKVQHSAWTSTVVPTDVLIPVWHWIKDLKPTFDRPKLPVEEKFQRMVDKSIEGLSVVATAGLTIWKVLRAEGDG